MQIDAALLYPSGAAGHRHAAGVAVAILRKPELLARAANQPRLVSRLEMAALLVVTGTPIHVGWLIQRLHMAESNTPNRRGSA